MTINIEEMSRDELIKLRGQVEAAISNAEAREKTIAKQAAEEAVAKFGFSLDEITAGSSRGNRGHRAKAPARYRNPEDPSQTWSGRGRQPFWFKAALKAGTDPSSLEI